MLRNSLSTPSLALCISITSLLRSPSRLLRLVHSHFALHPQRKSWIFRFAAQADRFHHPSNSSPAIQTGRSHALRVLAPRSRFCILWFIARSTPRAKKTRFCSFLRSVRSRSPMCFPPVLSFLRVACFREKAAKKAGGIYALAARK